ncbi:hypothetical protein B5G20_02795 [Collinsella sp. An7]|uniref:Lar family restriction alleviation protein n=1 Tax=Collinsella sp. An7 TaxID=1965651 RepID=UPI000B3A32AD|nr:Lar family restriction alleviation protein [Collinsella sp. An7]OUN47664.1 hypothetical protein B5G20_02795 [Collinsella sp. An7]
MTELKRCPFCGAEAEIVRNSSGSYFARCTNRQCAAKTRLYHENENGARLAWNSRAERTCHVEVSHGSHGPEPRFEGDVWTMHHVCSECGGAIGRDDVYCKHCGSRVVSE